MADWLFSSSWGYFVAGVAFVLGLAVGVSTGFSGWGVFSAFVLGALFGRVVFRFRRNAKLVPFLVVSGAFLGALIGAFFGLVFWMILAYFAGCIAGYLLHVKGLVESVEY